MSQAHVHRLERANSLSRVESLSTIGSARSGGAASFRRLEESDELPELLIRQA